VSTLDTDLGLPTDPREALAIQNAVLASLIEYPAMADAIPRMLIAIGTGMRLDFGAIWLLEAVEETLHCVGTWAPEGVLAEPFLSATRAYQFNRGEGLPGRVWLQGEASTIDDVTRDPNFPRHDAARQTGLRGAFAFPILGDGRVLGVVEGFSKRPGKADLQTLQAVQTVGRQVGLALLREQADRSKAELAARLSTLIDNVHGGMLVEDEHRRIRVANQAFCDLFGLSIPPESLVGADCMGAAETVKHLFRDPTAFVSGTERCISERRPSQGERLLLADGRIYERDYAPILLEGELDGHFWTYRDVSAVHRAEQENAHLRGFYERVLEAVPAQVAVFDSESRFLYVNSASITDPDVRNWVIGRTNEDYCRHRGVPTEVGLDRDEAIREVAQDGRIRYVEETFERHGVVRWFGRYIARVVAAPGEPVLVVGFGHEITEMKLAAVALAASESRMRAVLESALDCVITIDTQGRILEFSPSAERTFGYTREEVVGLEMADLLVPHAFREAHRRGMRHFLATGEGTVLNRRIEISALRSDDTEFPVELAITAVRLAGGQQIFTAFLRDISERRRAEGLIRESEERLRLVLDGADLGTWDLHIDSGVLDFNDRCLAMLGHGSEEVGARVSTFGEWSRGVHPEDAPGMAGAIEAHLRGETDGYESEHRLRHSSGEWVWVLERGRIIEWDPDGRPLRACGTRLNIDARKRAETEAHEARLAAETSAAAKQQFLANVSHELRTPLNAIVGLTHLLDRTLLDEKQLRSVEGIHYSAEVLLGVISDILDFSRVQSGRIELEEVTFELRPVVEGLVESLLPASRGRALSLDCVTEGDVPAYVIGDPGRLKQILLNLVGNAIKFTETGGVSIRVSRTRSEGESVILRLSVADTGIGISAEDRERIFEAFQQARPETNRRFGGSGLGLAVVNGLVQQWQGTVGLESEVGVGSTFHVTLPFGIALPNTPGDAVASAAAALSGRRLLVVEDNELNRLVAREILEQAGAVVETASDGLAALERLRTEPFDLVLMDIQMPGMDGYEVTRRIRQDLGIEADRMPVVALTATALTDERRRAYESGMNECVLKPFRPEWLYGRIAALLPERGSARGSLDRRILEDNTLGQPQLAREVLAIFGRNAPEQLVRLEDAAGGGNAAVVRALAHALKSQAGTIGAVDLQGAMEELETAAGGGSQAPEWRIEDLAATAVALGREAIRHAARLEAELAAEGTTPAG